MVRRIKWINTHKSTNKCKHVLHLSKQTRPWISHSPDSLLEVASLCSRSSSMSENVQVPFKKLIVYLWMARGRHLLLQPLLQRGATNPYKLCSFSKFIWLPAALLLEAKLYISYSHIPYFGIKYIIWMCAICGKNCI